jgi:fructokinase
VAASVTGEAVLVAGEALVDLVPEPDGQRLAARLGGGPFNTARTLARLGRPARFLGALSSDRFGSAFRDSLSADGVALDAVIGTDAPTTLALAEVDADGVASYRFYTEGTSAPAVDATAALAVAGRPGALHVGTLGLVLEPLADAVEQLVATVAGESLVMVDPNIRAGVITDASGYRARLHSVLAASDVVKVSVEDLAWLVPGRAPVEAARELLRGGPAAVLVTAGSEGALAVTAAGEALVPAAPVQVVDTIGAGDAFGGGFLAAWLRAGRRRDELGDLAALREAVGFASLVAGLTCAVPGAQPPALAEVEALAARLQPG